MACRFQRAILHAGIAAAVVVTCESTSCIEEGVSWEPRINGTAATSEADSMACQRRCLRTEGCYHFSFHKAQGECSLHGISAERHEEGSADVESGPFECVTVGKDGLEGSRPGYVPQSFQCVQVGVRWEPSVQIGSELKGSQVDLLLQCQGLCALQPGCERFTMDLESRSCFIVASEAAPVPASDSALSGSVLCGNAKDSTDAFLKKFQTSERLEVGSTWRSPGAIAALTAVGMTLVALASLQCARRPQPRSPASRFLEDAEDDDGTPSAADE